MADTGNKVVTISQAARYLGKDVSGGIGDSVITLRQLRAMRDGSKATPTVLPSGYTELEYIESSGSQYIDTGFKPKNTSRVVVDIEPTSGNTTNAVFGGRTGTNEATFCVWAINTYRTDYGSAAHVTTDVSAIAGSRVTIDKNKGVTTIGSKSWTQTSPSFTADNSLALFTVHGAGRNNLEYDDRCFHGKLYSCQVYDNGTEVRGFVPVKRESDGAIGLYDTIGGQFYANDGTGSFTAGPVVPNSADPRDGLVVRVSQLARIEIGPTIVSWATGTDEEIAAMVKAADAGIINLSDYWATEETRTVHLSAMPGSVDYANESHAAQDVQMVLTDPGHYTLANGKKCSFVVLQKDCLKEYGVMNSRGTNRGGWNDCPRRTWCNNVYRNAIPASLRGIFKQFKVRTASGSGSGATESTDWFSLFSEKEVFGSTTYANSSAESQNTQLNWFKTSSNRIKKNGMNGSASNWWERSPYSGYSGYFCRVTYSGNADYGPAHNDFGLSPFGCI